MKYHRHLFSGLIAVVGMFVLSSCDFIRLVSGPQGDGSGGAGSSFSERREEDRYIEWLYRLPTYIIPRINAYYELHPERFKRIGQSEEIEISGFAAFVKGDDYFKHPNRSYILSGTILDPWGQPLRFVQDFNMDGYIEAGGERIRVREEARMEEVAFTNKEHYFGIMKHSPFRGLSGNSGERIMCVVFRDARARR